MTFYYTYQNDDNIYLILLCPHTAFLYVMYMCKDRYLLMKLWMVFGIIIERVEEDEEGDPSPSNE